MKWYVLTVLIVVILSSVGLTIISITQDPFQADRFIKFLFFCSLFVFSWGIGTLIFLGFRNDFVKSFRRGLWLAILILAGIIFKKLGVLNIINFLIIFGVVVALEWFLTKTFKGANN
ncbi:MAG: hypothetical protein WD989_00315 [Candidatus Paceibacterota bacterium]